MDEINFLNLAKELDERPPVTEEKIRTAVSRAYYYLFLKIRASLESVGLKFKRAAEDHDEVKNMLLKTDITEARAVGLSLEELRRKRNDADYEMEIGGFGFGSNSATLAIAQAENAAEQFNRINRNCLKEKIRVN
ncbi:MAG: hypothetical protein HQL26_02245 [Candidatus Omnitrophica bacterium]|nr:hypothetical protein [Candidatus Omnitrophota bacterium]